MRTRLLVVGLSALFLAQAPSAGADEVVGGQPATKPYRFMVSVQLADGGTHFCGGTLVRKQWVLTAAHCVSDQQPAAIQVMAGSHRLSAPGKVIGVAEILVHENYPETGDHDAALLRLNRKAPYRPIRIVPPAEGASWDPGTPATALGWGTEQFLIDNTASDGLREVEVPIVSDEDCTRSYPFQFNPETMVCAGELLGGSDTCQGDSGGPLMVRDGKGKFVVMGVTSWGTGCGYPTFYGVYSRVADTTLYGWIDAHLP